jgi:dTDP-4-amino-4,6-dideoxygalactose transaminase
VRAALERVFQRGWFILGEEVAAFEAEFAAYLGIPFAVGVGSGTEALHLALRALDIGPGHEVITAPNAGVPPVAAIVAAGATPVFVDIHPESYTLDPFLVERAITPRTKAILPVHLYGQAADLDPILDIAHRHGLRVIEDACQAHGATYKGRKVGILGDAGCFSFYPTKNLSCYGDGGLVVTRDAETARRLRLLRNYGKEEDYRHTSQGFNSRLDELQAAVLRVKLKRLDDWNAARRARACLYGNLLQDSPVLPPQEMPYGEHVYHLYVVRTAQRNQLQARLAEAGIGTSVHYPIPTHLQEAYRYLGLGPGTCPLAERYAGEVLSLPMYAELPEEDIRRVCQVIKAS